MSHTFSFSHDLSIVIPLLIYILKVLFHQVLSQQASSFLFWHKGLNLERVHTALIRWNLHKLKQQRLFVWGGFGLHLAPSLYHGDSLNWHWRQWFIVTDTMRSVTFTLWQTCLYQDVTNAFPKQASCLNCAVDSDPVYSRFASLCTGFCAHCNLQVG